MVSLLVDSTHFFPVSFFSQSYIFPCQSTTLSFFYQCNFFRVAAFHFLSPHFFFFDFSVRCSRPPHKYFLTRTQLLQILFASMEALHFTTAFLGFRVFIFLIFLSVLKITDRMFRCQDKEKFIFLLLVNGKVSIQDGNSSYFSISKP